MNICNGGSEGDSGNKFHYNISWNNEAGTGFDSEDPMNTSYETLCNMLLEGLFDRWLCIYYQDSESNINNRVIDLYKYNSNTKEYESIYNSGTLLLEFRNRGHTYLTAQVANLKIDSNVPYVILIKDGLPVIKYNEDTLDAPNIVVDKFPIKESEVLSFRYNNTASDVGITSTINITPDFSDGKHTLTDFLVKCLFSGVDYSGVHDDWTENYAELINKHFKNCPGVTPTMPITFSVATLA